MSGGQVHFPTGMPNPGQPITGPDNIITRPWFNLLQAFFNRTGGAQGWAVIPTGTVVQYAGAASDIPDGWLKCGQAVSRTTYASLFSVIGITWGPGNGSTTFDLPAAGAPIQNIIQT